MDQTNDEDDEQTEKQLIEALLFTSPDPLKLRDFKKVVDLHGKRITSIIQQLNDEYQAADRAFEIREIADGYQLLTRAEFEDQLQDFYGREQDHSLSQAAMETLSIVAYEQPITRSELESVRGVQSGQLLRNLMDQGFLTMKGRKDSPGRPILYGTSQQFLEVFGLSSIDELPEPEELVD